MIDNDLPPLPDKNKKKRNGTLLFSCTPTVSLLIMQILGGVFEDAWELGLGRHYLG
ncbi:rpoE leader peptide RseD [Klebsiella pneumoniae]|nr:rpoE leader peptide RseD [Klebsiella pneumoniae]